MTRNYDRSKEYANRKRSPAYHSWNAMIQRCMNPNHRSYKCYGGRGVKVHESWIGNFAQFLADMGPRPEGLTLDRIDPFKDYGPENCRWANWETQCSNKRQNYDDEPEMTLEEIFGY